MEVPEVDGMLSGDRLLRIVRLGKSGTSVLADDNNGSLLCCNGEKFLRRSEKSRPNEDPRDEVNMLVRDVFAELLEPAGFSEKVTLVGLGVPLEDEKGFGSSLVRSF